jgi:hypothetical protein
MRFGEGANALLNPAKAWYFPDIDNLCSLPVAANCLEHEAPLSTLIRPHYSH